jgi:hypothetical protein
LRPNGIFILDYFNSEKIVADMKPNYLQTVSGIDFKISKRIENKHIHKRIQFSAPKIDYLGQVLANAPLIDFDFEEKVRLFTKSEFEAMFATAGLEILDIFGNYKLEAYDRETSSRMILKARKI